MGLSLRVVVGMVARDFAQAILGLYKGLAYSMDPHDSGSYGGKVGTGECSLLSQNISSILSHDMLDTHHRSVSKSTSVLNAGKD